MGESIETISAIILFLGLFVRYPRIAIAVAYLIGMSNGLYVAYHLA